MINLESNTNIELGQPAIIQNSSNFDIVNFQWFPAGLVDCSVDCDYQEVFVVSDTTLILEGTNEFGCSARDTLFIKVDKTRKVYFPNIISANNDGVNDVFMVYGSIPNVQRIQSLEIYDRWGAMIYEASDLVPGDESSGWNPNAKGNDFEPGVYVYVAEVAFLDGNIYRYSGSFTLNK